MRPDAWPYGTGGGLEEKRWRPSGHKEGGIVLVLMIGITATLGFMALGLGGFVLNKPPPLWRGGHPSSHRQTTYWNTVT
jgi:hypothetical protein